MALELTNFKYGHDAPIYSVIEEIIEQPGTPYFCFKDIDENKRRGAIRLRVETITYSLRRHRERLLDGTRTIAEIDRRLDQRRIELHAAASSGESHVMCADGTNGKLKLALPQSVLSRTERRTGLNRAKPPSS